MVDVRKIKCSVCYTLFHRSDIGKKQFAKHKEKYHDGVKVLDLNKRVLVKGHWVRPE